LFSRPITLLPLSIPNPIRVISLCLEQLSCQWEFKTDSRRTAWGRACAILLLRARRTDLDPADGGPLWNAQYECDRFGNIFGRDHPTRVAAAPGRASRKFRVDAARHDRSDPDLVITVVEHQCFAKKVEPGLGSVVSSAPAKRIF